MKQLLQNCTSFLRSVLAEIYSLLTIIACSPVQMGLHAQRCKCNMVCQGCVDGLVMPENPRLMVGLSQKSMTTIWESGNLQATSISMLHTIQEFLWHLHSPHSIKMACCFTYTMNVSLVPSHPLTKPWTLRPRHLRQRTWDFQLLKGGMEWGMEEPLLIES